MKPLSYTRLILTHVSLDLANNNDTVHVFYIIMKFFQFNAHNPMNTQITYLNIEPSIDALSLGICVNRKNLQNPVVKIFWEELIQEENTI